jgi:aminoglycoside/choline kinase family phosphotransferase
MTTEKTRTYKCARCGRALLPALLEQDLYSGFLLCKDDAGCEAALQDQGKGIEAEILAEIQELNTQRAEKIKELAQVRHEYWLPDPVEERNKREMARIAGDDQC